MTSRDVKKARRRIADAGDYEAQQRQIAIERMNAIEQRIRLEVALRSRAERYRRAAAASLVLGTSVRVARRFHRTHRRYLRASAFLATLGTLERLQSQEVREPRKPREPRESCEPCEAGGPRERRAAAPSQGAVKVGRPAKIGFRAADERGREASDLKRFAVS
jgi:hypothetical protein